MTAPLHRSAAARAALAAALGLGLAGCPLPQPLAEFPEGQTITPPRIRAVSADDTVIRVPAGCAGTEPVYALGATLFDQNVLEVVEARWFVDYHPSFPARYAIQNSTGRVVPASDVQNDFNRVVTPFTFQPYRYPPVPELGGAPAFSSPGVVHVVELVVSNGFAPEGETAPRPNRSPSPGFETQSFRWVFVNVAPEPGLPCP